MSNKTLKKLAWVTSGFSVFAILLNANMIIWCWPIWIIANLFWTYWAYQKKEWSQVVLWIAFNIANVYGWYGWYLLGG